MNRPQKIAAILLFSLAAIGLFVIQTGYVFSDGGLFLNGRLAPTLLSDGVEPAYLFEVNWAVLDHGRAQTLRLDLPDGERVTAVQLRRDTYDNGFVWVGEDVTRPGSEIYLSVVDDALSGQIQLTPQIGYAITTIDSPTHLIQQQDAAQQPLEQMDDQIRPLVPANGSSITQQAGTCSDDGSTIDVMVAYTPDARIARGGTAGMQAWINARITQMNLANDNSGVTVDINLVHQMETSYTPSESIGTDLNRLRLLDDGYMDELHAARETYKADVVALVVAEGNESRCGVGYLMSSLGNWFNEFAFSVTALDYPGPAYCSTTILSHEIGHNLGNQHDRDNSVGPGVYPFSYGYQSPTASFRTIMAYNCPGGCPIVNYWSNPDIDWNGEPMGIPHEGHLHDSAHNSRSMDLVAYTVANFKLACELDPTPTPTNTPTSTATAPAPPTVAPTMTNTPPPEPTSTQTPAPTPTTTATPTPTPTNTPSATPPPKIWNSYLMLVMSD